MSSEAFPVVAFFAAFHRDLGRGGGGGDGDGGCGGNSGGDSSSSGDGVVAMAAGPIGRSPREHSLWPSTQRWSLAASAFP